MLPSSLVASLLVLGILGCKDQKTPTPTPDTQPENLTGWVMGQVKDCLTPVTVVSWTENSGTVTTYDPPTSSEPPLYEPGGLALVHTTAGKQLFYTTPTGIERMALEGQNIEPVSVDFVVGAFSQGDFDGDDAPDLVIAGEEVAILWGIGTDEETVEPLVADALVHREVAVADFDGDTDLDLLVTDAVPDTDPLGFLYIENYGDRRFGEPTALTSGVGWDVYDLLTLDLNGDFQPDVYACDTMGSGTQPALLNSDGTLSPSDALGGLPTTCRALAIGDANNDGQLDVYVGDDAGPSIQFGRSEGYTPADVALLSPEEGQLTWGAAIADFDNDQSGDLVIASSATWVADAPAYPTYLFMGTADGRFVEEGAAHGLPTSAGVRAVVTTDLNSDGILDLVLGDGWRSPHILTSNGCTADAWLEVVAPEGTEVYIEAGGQTWASRISTDASFASTAPGVAHFGLGPEVDIIEQVTLYVPYEGEIVLARSISARQRIRWVPE